MAQRISKDQQVLQKLTKDNMLVLKETNVRNENRHPAGGKE